MPKKLMFYSLLTVRMVGGIVKSQAKKSPQGRRANVFCRVRYFYKMMIQRTQHRRNGAVVNSADCAV
jgi:hypothetical protein